MSVLVPVRQGAGPGGFVTRFRAVQGAGYATAVCVLWIVTFIFGAWIYTKYRMYVRIPIEAQGFWKTQGVFELKEHLATIGLGLLADLLVLLEERAQSRIRQRAPLAHRRRWPRWSGTCSWSATSSTTCGGSDHEHGDRHAFRRCGVVAGILGGVPRPSRWCSPSRADHLHGLRNAELAAVHLSSGRPTGSIWFYAAACKDEGPAMHWYGWTANTLIGSAHLRHARHDVAGKRDQKDSVVAHLDRAARLRCRS